MSLNNSIEVQHAEKARQAWELRLAGKTLRQIGQELGVSAATVLNWLRKRLDKVREQTDTIAIERLQVTLDRHERLLATYWDLALAGDIKAADMVLRIMDQQNKVLHQYQPQISITNNTGSGAGGFSANFYLPANGREPAIEAEIIETPLVESIVLPALEAGEITSTEPD